MKPLAIIGLDPGTTSGYVILDLNGQMIKSYSAKELSLSLVISQIIEHCQPIITATDKAKLPSFVEEFSRKLGTVIVTPDEDLSKEEKRKLISGFNSGLNISRIAAPLNTNNIHLDAHQQDSLAAAVYAYKKYSPKLEKINHFIQMHNLEDKRAEFTQLAFKEELNFQVIKDLLTKKNVEEKMIKQVIKDDKITKKDFLRLYEKLLIIKKENAVLVNKISQLNSNLNSAKKTHFFLDKKSANFNQRVDGLLKVKEDRMKFQEQEMDRLKARIEAQDGKILLLYSFIGQLQDKQLLKKLDNLGQKEFSAKNNILKVKDNDCLLIYRPEIYSESVLEQLKEKNIVLVSSKKFPPLIQQRFATVLLGKAGDIGIDFIENEHFALMDRKKIEDNLPKKIFIEKIIAESKEEREKRRIKKV